MKAAVLSILAGLSTALAQFHGDGSGFNFHNGFRGWQHLPGRTPTPVPSSGNATFSQLIDHTDPSKGTFEQFYYWSDQYWKPGGAVILMTPGEINVTGYQSYLTTNRTTGVLAEKIGAAVVVLEHRYWGTSTPYTELTTANMSYLTLNQSIHDLTYFANNVNLPFDHWHSSNAKDVPWVLIGGSYSGALTVWTAHVAPGTFWAYLGSSAVVEAVADYWAYFYPIQEGMPQNCSKDVAAVIEYMDNVLETGTAEEIYNLKSMFGLQNVTHNDDFMEVLANGPYLWQSNQLYTGYSAFYQWCDAVEGVFGVPNATLPGADGVGLEKALAGYASWVNGTLLPGYCEAYGYDVFQGTYNTYCFDTYDPTSPFFTDKSLSNQVDLQWNWYICTEFGYWQDGAPSSRPTIVSRLINVEYWTRQCNLYFPPGDYSASGGADEAAINAFDGGWSTQGLTRTVFTNGQFDPWRESTVSSDFRPGGPLQSTAAVPVNIVPAGIHCSDLITENGAVNPGAQAVIDAEVNQLAEWVSQWPHYGQYWRA